MKNFKNIKSEHIVKSIDSFYILKDIFSFLSEKQKLKLKFKQIFTKKIWY